MFVVLSLHRTLMKGQQGRMENVVAASCLSFPFPLIIVLILIEVSSKTTVLPHFSFCKCFILYEWYNFDFLLMMRSGKFYQWYIKKFLLSCSYGFPISKLENLYDSVTSHHIETSCKTFLFLNKSLLIQML